MMLSFFWIETLTFLSEFSVIFTDSFFILMFRSNPLEVLGTSTNFGITKVVGFALTGSDVVLYPITALTINTNSVVRVFVFILITMKNGNPFLAHTTVMGKMQKYNYTEAQVAYIVRSFIADQIERNCKTGGKFEDRSIPIGELLKAFNDKMINDILTSEDPIPVPSIKGLSVDKTEVIDRGKIVNDIERVYGKLDDKKLKKKLQEIAGLYFEDIVPLETLLSK